MKALNILPSLSFLIATFIFAESCTNEKDVEPVSTNRLYVCYIEKSSENEKTEIKIKNAHHFSKFKLMEKDIATLRKKNNELSRNVKCLIEKIEGFKEDKVEMKKIYENDTITKVKWMLLGLPIFIGDTIKKKI